MILFYAGLAIIFIGLGSVTWLLLTERKNSPPAEEPAPPLPAETTTRLLSRVGLAEEAADGSGGQPQKKSPFSELLSKFRRKDLKDDIAVIETEPRMRITKDILQTGTASVRLNPVPESAPQPAPYPPPVSPRHEPNLKEKYEKLDILLKEKTDALEKAEKALAVELRNRKEFNKVKDLLEKELKDDRVKYRDLQVQIGTAQMEATGYKSRVNQIELKVSKLEKTVTEQEHQLKEKDEKIFDRETKLKELTDKLSAKEKLETLKVPAEPPLQAAPEPPAQETPALELTSQPEHNLPPEPPIAPEPPQKQSGEEETSLKLPPDILTPQEPAAAPPESAPQEKTEPDPNSPAQ